VLTEAMYASNKSQERRLQWTKEISFTEIFEKFKKGSCASTMRDGCCFYVPPEFSYENVHVSSYCKVILSNKKSEDLNAIL